MVRLSYTEIFSILSSARQNLKAKIQKHELEEDKELLETIISLDSFIHEDETMFFKIEKDNPF